MEIVASGLGDDVDHAAAGAAILRHVIAGDDLKLLNGLLRNGGAHAIHRIVHGIRAVNAYLVRTRPLTAKIQAAGGGGAD